MSGGKSVKKGNDKPKKQLQRSKTDDTVRTFSQRRPEVNASNPMVAMEARIYVKDKAYHMQNILRDFDEHRPGAQPLRNAIANAPPVAIGDNATQKAEWLAFSGDLSAYHGTLETCSDTDVEKWTAMEYDRAIKRGEELMEGSTHWPSLSKMVGLFGSSRVDFPLPAVDRRKFAKILVTRVVMKCRQKRTHGKKGGNNKSEMVVDAVADGGELRAAEKNKEVTVVPAPELAKYPEITAVLGTFYTKMVDETALQFSTTVTNYLNDPNNSQASAGWKLAKALQPFVEVAAKATTSSAHGKNLGKLFRGEAVSDAEKKACKEHPFTTHEILCAIAPTAGKVFSLLGVSNRSTMVNKLKSIVSKVQLTALQEIHAELSKIEQNHLKSGRLSMKYHILNVGFDKLLDKLKMYGDPVQLSAEVKEGQQDEWKTYAEAAEKYVKTGATTAEQTNALKASATISGSYVAAHATVILLCKPSPTELQVTDVIAKVKEAVTALSNSAQHLGAMQDLGNCIQLWQKRQVGALFVNTKSELTDMLANAQTTTKQVQEFYTKWMGQGVLWKLWQIDMSSLNGMNTWLQDQAREVATKYAELKETVDARNNVAAPQAAALGVMKMAEGGEL
eukprot:g815.t1